ncbi:MAG TPA: glycosyltransferase [Terracidiphilus sp.]|nr:glycosyltransferase [Terracidiphilus sp.]
MRILAVLVRYQMPLGQSRTFQGLRSALASDPDLAGSYKVMIWDNTPEPMTDPQLPPAFLYRHSGANLGPSGAFNQALCYARARGHEWMLLLDQDMEIRADFLHTLLRHRRQVESQRQIAAVVPTVRVGKVIVSPFRQRFNRLSPYRQNQPGIAPGEAIAINSGSLVRVSAVEQIGGFSRDFWLDYSDFDLFHRFHLHGMRVWRAADTELQHEMSVMDYDRLMTPWRYRNFSHAESAFNDLYKGSLENAVQTLRVLLRAIRQRRKYRNPEFSRITWEQMKYRLTTSRKQRLLKWRADADRRQTTPG